MGFMELSFPRQGFSIAEQDFDVLQLIGRGGPNGDNRRTKRGPQRLFFIMRKTLRYARTSALPAIAAALALSSTPLLAQEAPAQPTTTDPTPVSATPAPVLETTTPTTADTTTPDVAPTAKTAAKAKPKRIATAAKPAARTVSKTTATRTTHASVPAAAAAPAVAPAPAAPATSQSSVKPIVDTSAAPPARPAQTAQAKPSSGIDNDTAMEVGGGTLALIALGAGAWAVSRRRRRHDEDEMIYEDHYEPEAEVAHEEEMAAAAEPAMAAEAMPATTPRHDPLETPNVVAPAASAFAWGKPDPATQAEDDGSDRRPGETWVERARRGPSPANPSVSLKNRLRRAAFFDKREREVAEGTAEPVDPDAGLPEAMAEDQERELV